MFCLTLARLPSDWVGEDVQATTHFAKLTKGYELTLASSEWSLRNIETLPCSVFGARFVSSGGGFDFVDLILVHPPGQDR